MCNTVAFFVFSLMLVTALRMTVTLQLAVLPLPSRAMAVIVASPAACTLTTPFSSTVAISGASLVQTSVLS